MKIDKIEVFFDIVIIALLLFGIIVYGNYLPIIALVLQFAICGLQYKHYKRISK